MAASTLWLLAQGAAVSLYLAFVGVIGGTVLALLLNLLAFSRFRLLRWCYFTYIYFVRGTPLLVQALLIFYALPSFGLRLGPLTAGALYEIGASLPYFAAAVLMAATLLMLLYFSRRLVFARR